MPGSAGNHLVILNEPCRQALCSSTKGWHPTGRPSISVPQWRPPITMAPSLLFSELNKPISRFVSARDCRACDLRMSASSCPAKASSNSIAKRSPFFDNPRKAALSYGARAQTPLAERNALRVCDIPLDHLSCSLPVIARGARQSPTPLIGRSW